MACNSITFQNNVIVTGQTSENHNFFYEAYFPQSHFFFLNLFNVWNILSAWFKFNFLLV